MTCWICHGQADSREHIIKRSDIRRVYDRASNSGEKVIAHVKNGQMHFLQGPDSAKLKYDLSLCHYCNTTFSQPFDLAYDTFIKYLYDNQEGILRKRFINFSDVFGNDFEAGQRNLYKYLAKSFGCRLHDAGISVPPDIVSLLSKDAFETGLRITFSVNEDVLLLSKKDRDGFIGKGDLLAWLNKHDQAIVNGYSWSEHVSWLFVNYWYLIMPIGDLGSTWVADCQHIYLGCQQPLTSDQRKELRETVSSLDELPD